MVAEWTPTEALSFWKACYAHGLEPSRLPARSAHLIAALLAKRFALSSRVLLIGERDPSLIEALLTAGFSVARADTGPWLRQPSIAIAGHDRWLGSLPRLDDGFDVVLSVGLLECLGDSEVAPFLTALRHALRQGGQVVLAVPNREELEQQLAVCPRTGTMFHHEQRVRAFDRLTFRTMLANAGLQVVSQLEIALDDQALVEHAARVFALSPKTFAGTGAMLIAFAQSAELPDRPALEADAEGANVWLSARRRLAAAVAIPKPEKWIWTGPTVDAFWSSIAGTPLDDLSFGKVLGQILLRGVEPWLVPGGRHLDIGAGEGHMAEVMAAAGYPVAAFEPAVRRAETIDARLASRSNFLGRLTRIEEAQKGSFDIVLACEVVEHVLEGDLDDFFALLKNALKPQGRIILSTPNDEDLSRAEVYSPFGNVLFHRWQHVRSLNKAKVENLLRRYGFEPDVVHEVDLAAALDGPEPALEEILGSAMPYRCGRAANLIVIARRTGGSPPPARRLAEAERRIERPVSTQGAIATEARLTPGTVLEAIELAVERAERADGSCYTLPLPSRLVAGDGQGTPRRSTLRLFEDGKELGPAHAVHASIAALGGGQFSHWDNTLLFSSSDGTDPTRNGRHYTALAEAAPAASLYDILNASNHRLQLWMVPVSWISAGEGRLYEVRLPRLFAKGDDARNPTRSTLQLFEDALPLGPAHAPHTTIRTDGKGRYAHWQRTLAFSSSDGTDPCHNGRRYVVVAPVKRSTLRRAIATAARITIKAMLPTARAVLPASVRAGVARYYDVVFSRISRANFLGRAVPLAAFEPAMTRDFFSSGPVVLCNNALAWGGAERQVVNTLGGLARRLHRPPHLLCVHLGRSADHDFYKGALADFRGRVRNVIDVDAARRILASIDAGLEQRMTRASAWLPTDVQQEILRFAGDFADLKPSVVHVWQDALSISAGYAAHMIGVPRILVSSRNMAAWRFAYHRPYMADAYREVASCSDIVMLNNSAAGARDYAEWLGLPVERFGIVRNGIDAAAIEPPADQEVQTLRAGLGLPPEAPVIGSIFRFYAEKRPKLWIEAAARIAAARSDCHFVVFGSGPLTGEVRAIARSHRFADRLHLPGTIEKAALGLAIMDLFLLTSELEGTPNVVLEASLMGVPVVATDAGGSRETIDEGVTGFIVAPPEPELLARRALGALGDEAWRREVRKAGPRFVRSRFGLDRMIDATLAAYGLKEW